MSQEPIRTDDTLTSYGSGRGWMRRAGLPLLGFAVLPSVWFYALNAISVSGGLAFRHVPPSEWSDVQKSFAAIFALYGLLLAGYYAAIGINQRVVISQSAVRVRDWLRQERVIPWSDVRALKLDFTESRSVDYFALEYGKPEGSVHRVLLASDRRSEAPMVAALRQEIARRGGSAAPETAARAS